MRRRFVSHRRLVPVLAGAAACAGFVLSLVGEARALPLAQALVGQPSQIVPAKIYRSGRSPIYPYYYNPGRPGGYSFFFGFVPYAKGDYGTQALNRSLYPQDIEWPPSMAPYGPRPGWGPKRSD
jgi:hypothetical protein